MKLKITERKYNATDKMKEKIAKKLEALGIKGIWNFSHAEVTSSIPVETVHLSDSLMTLAYKISSQEN